MEDKENQPESGNRIVKAAKYLAKNGPVKFAKKVKKRLTSPYTKYNKWFRIHKVTPEELEHEKAFSFGYSPRISILVPTYRTPDKLLCQMIESVTSQSYANWELCLADGSDEENAERIYRTVLAYSKEDDRIKYKKLSKNEGISGNTNQALYMATGDFIGLLDHDDILEPNALFEVAKALQDPKVDIVYTDEDKVSENLKKYMDPNFKPDFSIDLFRSHNYITHFFVARRKIVNEVGGFRSEFDGSQDYDLMFRCIEKAEKIVHVPHVLYHWRLAKGSTADKPQNKMYCYEAGRKAILAHYERMGIKAEVTMVPDMWGMYHTEYEVEGNPLLSIIIPNKDHTEDLEKCIESICEKSVYKNYEFIVVENNSTLPETFEFYKKLEAKHENVKVVKWEGEFNFSAINNFGVKYAKGEYLLLLNNDTELISEKGISEMLGICQRGDVGIVGAKLLYPDETVQHAGIVLGFDGYAGHVFHGIGRKEYGFMFRARVNCDYNAVTGACLMVSKEDYQKVGGLSEEFVVAANDVDFCLKIRKLGLLVVYDAFSEWYHYESKSRGYEDTPEKKERFLKEVEKFRKYWGTYVDAGDEYYNPNFPINFPPFMY